MRDLRRAALEEARFGIRAGRVDDAEAADLPALEEFCRTERVELLIVRCPAADIATVQALEDAGARLMDTIVYWERDFSKRPLDEDVSDSRIRPASAGDRPAIVRIAQESFANYFGHYHADPRLDPLGASDAYVEWATRSLDDPRVADAVLVAEVDGEPLAFGTFKAEDDGRGDFVLAAVAEAGRRHGLYRSVAGGGMAWAAARGCRSYYSSTQLPNLAVQKVWARLGMEPSGAVHTFHWWR